MDIEIDERVRLQYMDGYDIEEIADHLMLTVEEVENILKDLL
jgi:DNA-directed RNA polymerase specialized sigma24 family protein